MEVHGEGIEAILEESAGAPAPPVLPPAAQRQLAAAQGAAPGESEDGGSDGGVRDSGNVGGAPALADFAKTVAVRLGPKRLPFECALPPVRAGSEDRIAHLARGKLAALDHQCFALDEKTHTEICFESATSAQEAKNRSNIPSQEKFHRAILRGPRNISETP